MASSSQKSSDSIDLNDSLASNSSTRGKFEVPPLSLSNCPAFERNFIVCKDDLSSIKLYNLCHPRANRSALYQVDDVSVAEVLQIDGERSCFYRESVIKDFTCTMLSSIHPLFLLLPKLLKQTKSFTLEELATDLDYPALSLLTRIPATKKALNIACNCKENGRFAQNEVKFYAWMQKRFNVLIDALKSCDDLPIGAKESGESLRYFAFDIFSDYIPDSISNKLKFEWRIEKPMTRLQPPTPLPAKPANKRKADSTKQAKSDSKKRKVLADASKNTMKLNLFF
ncbi:hypothetical protein M3Y97_00754500 [Aphelenchoides bicaudatus]|nr:hypothetical protein M3Y97_00754500 [Aphelenchoides bicaudatus]